MAKIFKKGLRKLWKQEPVTFSNFATVPSQELVNLVKKMPSKFDKKSDFLEENSQGDKATTRESTEIKGIETPEEAILLHLKSGDNDKAAVLSE